MDDRTYMNIALELAKKGWGRTAPNPMVGALVVRDSQVVGRGYHETVGSAHAEVNALDDAGNKAAGATLYVTLEPCNHTGRTPPCTEKILASGIKRVVVAMPDPNPDVTGGGTAYLTEKGLSVETGMCRQEAETLNEAFVTYVRTKRPFVIPKCAATLDGRIATRTGDARWVSGEASRAYVHNLRHGVDGILVGINTVKKDNPSLTTRLETPGGIDPTRIILDTRLSIPQTAKVLRLDSDSDTIIVCGNNLDPQRFEEKKNRLKKPGVRVVCAPLKNGRIDYQWLLDRLGQWQMSSLLIEGGSQIIASALAENIVNKILFFYGPKLLGGDDGYPICRGEGPERMADALSVRDIHVERFGDDVLVSGYIRT